MTQVGQLSPTLMDILPVNSGSMKLLLQEKKDLLQNWATLNFLGRTFQATGMAGYAGIWVSML